MHSKDNFLHTASPPTVSALPPGGLPHHQQFLLFLLAACLTTNSFCSSSWRLASPPTVSALPAGGPLEDKAGPSGSTPDPSISEQGGGKGFTNVLNGEDLQTYALEIQRFHIGSSLPIASTDTRLDSWWTQVFDAGKHPALSKMISALLSCFHGPQIEGSFSIMGNVITTQTASMGIKTLDAIQSVKYSLKAPEE